MNTELCLRLAASFFSLLVTANELIYCTYTVNKKMSVKMHSIILHHSILNLAKLKKQS